MTYQEALAYLETRVMFGIKLGLDNMNIILAELGNPHEQLKFIHLAGTNGKGSTACLLNAALMAESKVGLYTSPHLISPRERFRINGRAVEESLFVAAVSGLMAAMVRLNDPEIEPTFFEVTTLIAILIFKAEACDYVVWETGMGGRLDSTNVVNPLVSIITNCALDHTGFLGETIAEVAAEKCGIIKENTPVFFGDDDEEVKEILSNRAFRKSALLKRFDCDFSLTFYTYTPNGMETHVWIEGKSIDIKTKLWGEHQAKNVALAAAVLSHLANDLKLFDFSNAISNMALATWPGRLQTLEKGDATLLVDGAHNVHAAEVLVKSLEARFPGKKWRLALGILKDKDVVEFLKVVDPIVSSYSVLPVANPRTLSTLEIIAEIIKFSPDKEVKEVTTSDLLAGLDGDDNLLTGSLYLIGELLGEFYNGELPDVVESRS